MDEEEFSVVLLEVPDCDEDEAEEEDAAAELVLGELDPTSHYYGVTHESLCFS